MLRPRVLVIGVTAPPYGGTESITEIILRSTYLQRHFDVVVLRLWRTRQQEQRGRFGIKNILLNACNLVRLADLMVHQRPEILYLPIAQNAGGFVRDSLFLWTGVCLRAKPILHFHGSGMEDFLAKRGRFFRGYAHRTLECSTKVIALAERLRQQFEAFVAKDKIVVLYNGVDAAPYIQMPIPRPKERPSDLNVLFMGNISRAKGAWDLVQAIPQVAVESAFQVKFHFVGAPINVERTVTFLGELNGGYTAIRDFVIASGLADCTEFHGELYSDARLMAFQKADIFVLPSYSEGFPMVVLEAMAAGLPLVVTPVGALPEVLEKNVNCLFVRPGDSRDLSDKIGLLVQDPDLRKQMGEANRRLVAKRFTAESFAVGLGHIWGETLGCQLRL